MWGSYTGFGLTENFGIAAIEAFGDYLFIEFPKSYPNNYTEIIRPEINECLRTINYNVICTDHDSPICLNSETDYVATVYSEWPLRGNPAGCYSLGEINDTTLAIFNTIDPANPEIMKTVEVPLNTNANNVFAIRSYTFDEKYLYVSVKRGENTPWSLIYAFSLNDSDLAPKYRLGDLNLYSDNRRKGTVFSWGPYLLYYDICPASEYHRLEVYKKAFYDCNVAYNLNANISSITGTYNADQTVDISWCVEGCLDRAEIFLIEDLDKTDTLVSYRKYSDSDFETGELGWNVHGISPDVENHYYNIKVVTQNIEGIHKEKIFNSFNIETQSGDTQWQPDGLCVCTNLSDQVSPYIVCNGDGYLDVCWTDLRSDKEDYYCQRIDDEGDIKWVSNGRTSCKETCNNSNYKSVGSESGDLIITWDACSCNKIDKDIYAQKINQNGVLLWDDLHAYPVCISAGDQTNPVLTTDGSAGIIIAWQDSRYTGNGMDIYAQKIDSSGVSEWDINGKIICSENNDQRYLAICGDGQGGAYLTWEDKRGLPSTYIYAQRVDGNGNLSGPPGGISICSVEGYASNVKIIKSGSDGAIIAWLDLREGQPKIYAQRILSNGNTGWSTNGIPIYTRQEYFKDMEMTSDGNGGAIITWVDSRNGSSELDVFAQRIDADGTIRWASNGIPVCTASGLQEYPKLAGDGKGYTVATWRDSRNEVTTGYDEDVPNLVEI